MAAHLDDGRVREVVLEVRLGRLPAGAKVSTSARPGFRRERRSLVGGPRAPMMDTKLHREGPIRAREAQYVGVRLLALEVDGRADRRVLVRGDLVRMLVVVDEEAQRRVCVDLPRPDQPEMHAVDEVFERASGAGCCGP